MPTKQTTKTNEKEAPRRSGSAAVVKVGNLTRDPELRFGEKGTAFTSFGLAVNKPKVPGDWRGEKETTFYDVVCFGTLAEHTAECLTKGARVIVTGRPEVETYTAKDGTQKERKRILADALGPELRWDTVIVQRVTRTKPDASEGAKDQEEDF